MILGNNSLLINASSIGDLSKVKELLRNGANIYYIDERNNTALHVAAMNGHLNVVKELLSRGAVIYTENKDYFTPFELANNESKLEVVNFLLNRQDNYGKALLHYAIDNRNQKLIDLLLEKRADVNVKNEKGDTPLHVAVKTSNSLADEMSDFLDIVRKLLDKGAKIYARNKDGFTSLRLVKRGSDLEMFFFNYQDNSGSTLLHHAAFGNDPKLIKLLLNELRFDINIINKEGNTPLHVAARYGKLNAVKGLLKGWANIDARNNVNNTPLHIAARYGQLDVVKELLDKKAKIYTRNKAGNAPLHVAARYGKLNAVKGLLKGWANIDARNNVNNTPLHIAARYG